jgi:hypothetical protein
MQLRMWLLFISPPKRLRRRLVVPSVLLDGLVVPSVLLDGLPVGRATTCIYIRADAQGPAAVTTHTAIVQSQFIMCL